MAKDPAFLFYTQDFLVGTMFMTDKEVGIYTRLLCIQHQSGGIISKNIFKEKVKQNLKIIQKFVETNEGFYNERLFEEMKKRENKSNILRNNVNKRWEKEYTNSIQKEYNCNTSVIQIENENEINIINSNSNSKDINKGNIINIKDNIVNNINDNNDNEFIEMFIKGFGRNPKQIEFEKTKELVNKFGFEKMQKAFTGAGLRNFKSLSGLIDYLDDKGNLLSYAEKYKKPKFIIEEDEYYKQPYNG